MRPNDYPAAHSMDSTWFGVDDDGHVAVFSSGEEGPVPRSVQGEESGLDSIRLILTEGVRDLIRLGYLRVGRHIAQAPSYSGGVFLLRDPIAAPKGTAGDERIDCATVTIDGKTLAPVHYGWTPKERFEELHANGNCQGCLGDDGAELAEWGVYTFDCGDYEAPPYQRVAAPSRPLRLDDLSPNLRAKLKPAVLPSLRFETAKAVQPFEHVDSNCWGNETFLGTDGEKYPVAEIASVEIPRDEPPAPEIITGTPATMEELIEQLEAAKRRQRWWQFWKHR